MVLRIVRAVVAVRRVFFGKKVTAISRPSWTVVVAFQPVWPK
jgi:hypothetical protein